MLYRLNIKESTEYEMLYYYVLATKQRGVLFCPYHWKGKCLGFRHVASTARRVTDNECNSSFTIDNVERV